MKQYTGHWCNGITKTITANSIDEARSRLAGWALLRSNNIPNCRDFKVTKADTNFDTFFKCVLFVIGCIGVLVMLCVLRDNEVQPLTNIEFFGRGLVGSVLSLGAIVMYKWRYENV